MVSGVGHLRQDFESMIYAEEIATERDRREEKSYHEMIFFGESLCGSHATSREVLGMTSETVVSSRKVDLRFRDFETAVLFL
jgi:hypothetical protein